MLKIKASTTNGRVAAPPSKSYTHRALTLALLTEDSVIEEPLLSADPLATLANVRALGATATEEAGGVRVRGGRVKTPEEILDCRNSGTTLRLHTAVAGLADGTSVLTGDASLRRRPMQPLLDALQPLDVDAFSTRGNGCAPVVVRGPMRGGVTTIPGDVSSQYVSALILAGTQAPDDVEIRLSSPLKSRPYVTITVEMVRAFGGRVDETPHGYLVPGAQKLAGTRYRVPGDYSTAAFPLAAAAITGGEVTVENLDPANPQGDKAILECLREFGCEVREEGTTVTVRRDGPLQGITRDLGDTPDMFPILTAIAAYAEGDTVMHNAKHLRFKESDRIAAMVTQLSKMGVDITERDDGAVVHGGSPLKGASVHTWHDHRILMALAVAGLGAEGETVIDEHESYAVSYPRFLEDFKGMGASMEVG